MRADHIRYSMECRGAGTGIRYQGMADLHHPDGDGYEYTTGWACGHLHDTWQEAVGCARQGTKALASGQAQLEEQP